MSAVATDAVRDRHGCEGRMTGAARSYLLGLFYRHVAIGLLCVIVFPGYSTLLGLSTVRSVMPMQAWGALFFVVALPALGSVLRNCDRLAHVALILSVVLSVAWSVLFLYAWSHGPSLAPLVAVKGSSLVWKDLTIASQRLRAPPGQRRRTACAGRPGGSGTGAGEMSGRRSGVERARCCRHRRRHRRVADPPQHADDGAGEQCR